MNFFSLINMMYWISQESGESLTINQIQYCLMRNFGGKTDVSQTVKIFLKKVPAYLLQTKQSSFDVKVSTN